MLASIPMAAILVAMFTVHLPYGFSSIKLQAVTAAGAQFGPPGYETDLLYLASLATLVIGGSRPLSIDGLCAAKNAERRGANTRRATQGSTFTLSRPCTAWAVPAAWVAALPSLPAKVPPGHGSGDLRR